jgi:hypothetical protein
LFISRLACSLVGRTKTISLEPGSLPARFYGRTVVQEQCHCNFGVNPVCVDTLRSGALRIVGSDDEGIVRAVELAGHPCFIGTLFLPQHHSTPASPHPLISGFLSAVSAHNLRGQMPQTPPQPGDLHDWHLSHPCASPFGRNDWAKPSCWRSRFPPCGGELYCRQAAGRVAIGGRAVVYSRSNLEIPEAEFES